MKKFLSLVMALAMTFSLVTISAGAKDFADNSKIAYDEAVAVVSEIGVIDGYTDGTFKPTETLTRGAAAKIICNLILGPTTASALSADAAPFKDVPANHVFAGYIAYCAQQGIINGYGDGTFKPAGTLTGYQFMKMLLGALGYDGKQEGFTGANWSIPVAKLAKGAGLDEGNDEFVGTSAVTREEACLYAFNTLKATMVEYPSQTNIVVGDINISTVAKADNVRQTGYKDMHTNPSTHEAETLQFAERYFPKLKVDDNAEDDFKRPANKWTYKSEKIGTYAIDADATYTANTKVNDIYNDLGLSKKVNATVFLDGKQISDLSIVKGGTAKTSGGNGTLVEVYKSVDDYDVVSVKIVMIGTYVGEVQSIKAATSTKDRSISINSYSANKPAPVDYTYETEEFATEDLVSFTIAWNDADKYTIQDVAALTEVASGTLTAYKGTNVNNETSNFTAGGTTYKYAQHFAYEDDDNVINGADLKGKTDLDVYTDAYGYALYVKATESVKNYAVLTGLGRQNVYGDDSWGCTLLLPDGTKVTGIYDKDDSTTLSEGDIVTYSTDSNGVYTLKAKGVFLVDTTDTGKVFTNGKSRLATIGGVYGLYTTDTTIFFVKVKGESSKYNAYTGYAAAPSILAGANTVVSYVVKAGTKQVEAIYFTSTDATKPGVDTEGGSGSSLYIIKGKDAKVTSDSLGAYYELPAIVDGEISTVMVKYDVAGTDALLNRVGGFVVKSYSTNSDGVITSLTLKGAADQVYTAVGTVAVSGGVVGFGASKATADYFAFASDVDVFYANADKDVLTESAIGAIGTDATDIVTYVLDDDGDYVKAIYVETVDD